MDEKSATLSLPKELLEHAIQQQVSLAVAKAMGDESRLLTEAVGRVLTQMVDSDGKPTNSSYDAKTTYVQWLIRGAVANAVKTAITEEVGRHEEVIRKEIARQLSMKNSPLLKQLTTSLTTGIVQAASNKWRLTVNIEE